MIFKAFRAPSATIWIFAILAAVAVGILGFSFVDSAIVFASIVFGVVLLHMARGSFAPVRKLCDLCQSGLSWVVLASIFGIVVIPAWLIRKSKLKQKPSDRGQTLWVDHVSRYGTPSQEDFFFRQS